MQRQKIGEALKTKILAESYEPGCVITKLAKQYGISEGAIYGWRNKSSSPQQSVPNVPAAVFDNRFVELSVIDPKQIANLQEVSLRFDKFSFVMQGSIKSSTLIAIVNLLEESC
jgi:transposase-like protein